jgi:hypothetical protein
VISKRPIVSKILKARPPSSEEKRGQVINLEINSSSSNILPYLERLVSNTLELSTMSWHGEIVGRILFSDTSTP